MEENEIGEHLLGLLLPDAPSLSDSLSDEYQNYINNLTGLSLAELRSEPNELKKQSTSLKGEMEELAYQHYPTFIQTSTCVRAIHEEMKLATKSLDSFQQHLPSLSSSCKEFGTVAQKLSEERQLNHHTLSQHTTVLELLEIPQWMEQCVRGGYYEEGLELRTFARRLYQRHPEIKLTQSIKEEVEKLSGILLNQLLRRLRGEAQLPEYLRTVGLLRRLEVFSEKELRLAFLLSRDSLLLKKESAIPTQNAFNLLDTSISLWRLDFFDTITVYRSIFSDESITQDGIGDGGILYSWMQHKIANIIEKLKKYLDRITNSEDLYKLLDQWMYFGMSMARVGLDFRGLLPPVFETKLLSQFDRVMKESLDYFKVAIEKQDFVLVEKNSSTNQLSYPLERQDIYAYNSKLLDFYPIAVLTNGFLSAFNDFCKCAPLNLQMVLAQRVGQILEKAVLVVKGVKSELRMNSEKERHYYEMVKVMSKIFVPYIIKCFAHVFNDSPVDIIDSASIIAPLAKFLPKEEARKESAPASGIELVPNQV